MTGKEGMLYIDWDLASLLNQQGDFILYSREVSNAKTPLIAAMDSFLYGYMANHHKSVYTREECMLTELPVSAFYLDRYL